MADYISKVTLPDGNTYDINADKLDGEHGSYYQTVGLRNLIARNAYSSSITGFRWTNGKQLTSGNLNRINFSGGSNYTANPYKAEAPGYYSISFWYKVENFSSGTTIHVNISDTTVGYVDVSANKDWTFWSGTCYYNGSSYGFVDFEGTFNATIILSDIVVVRGTNRSQTWFPAPENLVDTYQNQTIAGTKTFSNKITGSISGNADGNAGSATKFNSTRKIELTGAVTGSATTDGSEGWTINTSVNHGHGNITSDGKMSGSTASGNTTTSHKFLREDGTWAIPKYTTDTNNAVTQTGNEDNKEYSILLKNTNNTTNETAGVKFGKKTNNLVTVNPSTGTIKAVNFSGKIQDYTISAHDLFLCKNSSTYTTTTIPTDTWYVKIVLNFQYSSAVSIIKMYTSYSNVGGTILLYLDAYKSGQWHCYSTEYNSNNIISIKRTTESSKQCIYVGLKKPTTWNGSIPQGDITVQTDWDIVSIEEVATPADMISLNSPGYTFYGESIKSVNTNFKGNATTASAANLTTTANAIAYYTNTTGTFGTKASANGALYATSANGTLNWGILPAAQGGTGQSSYTIGDILYSGEANKLSKLSGNTTTTRKFLRSVATTSGTATAPIWDTVTKTDVGLSNVTNDKQLPIDGGTMTGVLTLQGNQYTDSYSGALNANNSNIYGLNSIYTADAADNAAEGIHFYRDTTHVDTLWINGGDILFVPNRALGTSTTKANSQKVARFTTNPTTAQVVITDGATGGVKSQSLADFTSSLGLSNALHFIGITSTELSNGSTTATLTAKSTNSLSKTTGFVDGDVVMDGDQLREYVWVGTAWRLLGITTSTAYSQTATGNSWITSITQGTDGKITATTGTLNTSGEWNGNAATASKLKTVGRLTSLNIDFNNTSYNSKFFITHADASTSTGKPSSNSIIMNLAWDNLNSDKYGAQIAIHNSATPHLQIRGCNNGTWDTSWLTVLDSNNSGAGTNNNTTLTWNATYTLAKINGTDIKFTTMTKPTYAFTDLTSHPTTISGYGITDAKIASGVITLGSNTITPVTSITIKTTSPVSGGSDTATTTTGTYTISLANAYGDTKNPYDTKTANYILAGPTSGDAAAPSFRAMVEADLPYTYFRNRGSIAANKDLNDYTANGTYFNATGNNNNTNTGFKHTYGYIIALGKYSNNYQGVQIEISTTGKEIWYRTNWYDNNTGNVWYDKYRILTTANTITAAQGGTGQSSYTTGDILYASTTTTLAKLSGNTTKTRKFLRSVATTAGTAVAPAWDTLTADDIPSITKSKISDFPTEMTPASHTHGNISNDGKISETGAIGANYRLVIVKPSNAPTDADKNKVITSSIVFDGSTTNQALTKAGTWVTFNNYSHPTDAGNKHIPSGGSSGQFLKYGDASGTATWSDLPTASTDAAGIIQIGTNATNAMAGNTVVTNVSIAVNDTTSTDTFPITYAATNTATTSAKNDTLKKSTGKLYFKPSTGELTATKFIGPLTGNVTGDVSGSSGSCTGNAATATKLGTSDVGSARQAIYLSGGTATAGNYTVAHLGKASKSNMNDIGKLWPSTGMTSLTSTANADTPKNGDTYSSSWHLYWDTCYSDNPGGSNSWAAQIVNKAGTSSWWVRSRQGGTITNGTAWASGWRHLVTSTEAAVGSETLPVYINDGGQATVCSVSKAPYTKEILVEGDAGTWYPVKFSYTTDKTRPHIISIWKNLGSTTASYSGNHSNGTSSMWVMYEHRYNGWDGNGGYGRSLYYSMPYATLIAKAQLLSSGVGSLCVWLRGGGTKYWVSSDYDISATVYYEETNTGNNIMVAPVTEVTSNGWRIVSGTFYGNSITTSRANITSTSNAIAYYTDTTGTFGSKASANGALYATETNGALSWGTLPVAQGGTGQTSIANIQAGKDGDGNAINSTYLKKSGGRVTGDITLYTSGTGDSPALIFQREDALGGSYYDWRIINSGGTLKFQDAGSHTSNAWTTRFSMYTDTLTGKFSGSLTGNADTATQFSSNATVTLTGDTTGTSSGSKKSWSVATTTSKMTPTDASSKDLNTLTDLNTAYYYAGGSNTATHGPVTAGTAFGLHMFRTAAGWVRQEFAVNNGDKYYRSYGSNAWSDWVKYLSSANYNSYAPTLTGTGASGSWEISITGNAATATAIQTAGTTAQFYRGDNTWSNEIQQTTTALLGIDNNYKIGTAKKDLNFVVTSGTGNNSGLNNGNAGGITWGNGTNAYAGIYYQASSGYGSRLLFGTTGNFSNGAYARMIIHCDGKVELPINIASESTTTGSLVVAGGAGVAGKLYVGDVANVSTLVTTNTGGLQIKMNRSSHNWIQSPTDSDIAFCVHSSLSGDNGSFRIAKTHVDSYRNEAASLGTSTVQWNGTYSKSFIVNQQITLQWNDTDSSLDFVFA